MEKDLKCMGKARRLPDKLLCILMESLLLGGMLLAGCGDAPPQPTETQPTSGVSADRRSTAQQAASAHFTDVTAAAGIGFRHEAGATGKKWYPETMGAGGGFFDYDGDGLVDILLVNGRRWPGERQTPEPTMHLYRNQGDGTFRDVTRESGLAAPLYGMGMAAADYDNDGDQDLLITGYQDTRLFRNHGDGTLTDVSMDAGLAQGRWSTAALFVDVDRDGWLDLVVGYYVDWDPSKEAKLDCTYGTPTKDYCAVTHFVGQGLTLYRNLGDGRFQDVTGEAGMQAPGARVLGLTGVDYNQDRWPDVVVANDLTPSLFFANNGDGTFREIGVQTGLVVDEGGVAFAGMGIDAAYVNNDAQLCIAIGNFTGQPTTLHCQAQAGAAFRPDVFIEQSPRAGLARPTLPMVTFGLFFFDVDLDGWQDLFMVNGHVVNEERLRHVPYAQPPQLFRNRGNGTFEAIKPAPGSGLDIHIIGRGAAYADYDHDGDLDLLLTANQGPAYLLRNEAPRPNHFLRVVTQGTRSNRDGIGAQVRLHTERRQLTGAVRTGSSYLSQSELPLTFGLAPGEHIDRLEILWPSGTVDVFRHIQANHTFLAREGASQDAISIAQRPVTPTPLMTDGAGGGVVSSAPTDYLALKRTAIAHYQAGRVDAAADAFEQVLQRQPADYIAQQYLIELHWRRGARGQARVLLTKMARGLPEANFLMQFGFHLEEVRLPDLADAVYREAARLDPPAPDFAEAYTHLGKIYARTGRLDEAIQAYQRVIELEPDRAQGHHNLGAVLAAKGLADAAMVHFQEALRRDPHYLPARNDLGALYAGREEIEEAIAAFSTVVRLDPGRAEAHYNLAMAYAARGDAQAMIRELQETLRLDPRHVEAHLGLGMGYLEQGKMEAAVERFRSVVRLDPHHPQAHGALATLYFRQQRYDLAWRHGQRAAELGAPVQPLLEALRQVLGGTQ